MFFVVMVVMRNEFGNNEKAWAVSPGNIITRIRIIHLPFSIDSLLAKVMFFLMIINSKTTPHDIRYLYCSLNFTMLFLCWIEYPHMMVCIHRTLDNGYHCSKYQGGKKVMGVTRQFSTKEELRTFLLKQPSAPTEKIEKFIQSLE